MHFPLRFQILLPFALLQLVTLLAIASFSGWLALRRVEAELSSRLGQISTALEETNFPLTQPIVDQLARLTGAELILWDDDGRVVRVSSGLDLLAVASPALLAHESVLIAGRTYVQKKVVGRDAVRKQTVSILYPQESIDAARWNAVLPPLLLGGLLVVLTALTSFFIAGSVSSRVDELHLQAQRIASGDFREMPIPARSDELQNLALAFNEMAAALESSRRVLQEAERSRLLTQLIGGLAHQLRNAITGARISVQLHQRRCPSSEDTALERALAQLTLTEEQIKALLRVTRGEERTLVSGDVPSIIDETLRLVTPMLEHHHITLETDLTHIPCLVLDADAIRAALVNLMMNAIEASGPLGRVCVWSKFQDELFQIELANTGPELTPQALEKIFTPFFSTKQEGVGLGLFLARQSVEDCRGTLSVHTIDGMTIFRIQLPKV